MNTVTKSHFAGMCGVSKVSITKACKAGKLGLVKNGKREVVNLDHRLTKEYLSGKKPQDSDAEKPKSKPKSKDDPLVITAPESDEYGELAIKSLDDIDESNIHLLTKNQIDIFKGWESALATRQKREEARSLLIRRETVKLIFSKIYTVDNNELKTMEDRLAPAICGIFGEGDDSENSVKVRKLLNDEITKALHHIKRIINDHLVKVGSDKI